MRASLVVIIHIRQQHVTEMPLAEHNNVVKALPSDRTDQSFSISVLPWGPWRRRSIANTHLDRARRLLALHRDMEARSHDVCLRRHGHARPGADGLGSGPHQRKAATSASERQRI